MKKLLLTLAALALAAEAQVDRGETQVLQEGRVVGAGAQGADPERALARAGGVGGARPSRCRNHARA